MKYDVGTIITVVCVLLFYLRLIVIQRHRVQTARYQYAQMEKKNEKKNSKTGQKPEVRYARLGIHFRNWWFVGLALILITFGAAVAATKFLGPSLSNFWWIPIDLGIGLFALSVN